MSVQVNEAVMLLTDYNSRLAAEMEYRKKLTTMLSDFLQAQRELLTQAEHRLEVRISIHAFFECPDLNQLRKMTDQLKSKDINLILTNSKL